MHNAPSVTYPVGRSRFSGWLSLLLWLVGLASVLMWWNTAAAPGWRGFAMALAVVVAGICAGVAWWRSAVGQLHWDGESWQWTQHLATREGTVTTRLDLQKWMLLQWQAGDASRWLWLERSREPASWDDLRRAVYSRARPNPLPMAQPAAGRS
ncbi:hypothetical protein [Caenimonas koreensis]|uniref:hypothetical protein n=1 Tax=Caenimonas koreensis TaxID=367474 RepID=UPI0037842F38